MINAERWKKELGELLENGYQIALKDGVPTICSVIQCSECYFGDDERFCSNEKLTRWLISEYQEAKVDWSKVKVDTKILVSNDGLEWKKRYFAKYEDDLVYAWVDGMTSWSVCGFGGGSIDMPWRYAKLVEEGELDG